MSTLALQQAISAWRAEVTVAWTSINFNSVHGEHVSMPHGKPRLVQSQQRDRRRLMRLTVFTMGFRVEVRILNVDALMVATSAYLPSLDICPIVQVSYGLPESGFASYSIERAQQTNHVG